MRLVSICTLITISNSNDAARRWKSRSTADQRYVCIAVVYAVKEEEKEEETEVSVMKTATVVSDTW